MVNRDLILNNLYLKLTALMLAILVWLAFHRSDSPYSPVSKPVEAKSSVGKIIKQIPISLLLPVGDTRQYLIRPPSVEIELSGELSLLKFLPTNEIRAFLDVIEFRTNESKISIQVNVPKGVQVEVINPDKAQIELHHP